MLLRMLVKMANADRGALWARVLAPEGVVAVLSPQDRLRDRLAHEVVDLVLLDDSAPASVNRALADVASLSDGPEVVVFCHSGGARRRAELLASGALAVLDSKLAAEELRNALAAILDRRRRQVDRELRVRDVEESRLSDFATASPAMREFLALVRRVVDTDSTLLLQGETGVGKEYLSRAIHSESPRGRGPFVAVNCSALSETLLESELFGHVEGAFTGATRSRRGYFELAHGGTLFLDEIGELSPKLQVKLLRVLQDRRIQAVGAEVDVEVDVRLIAATNRNLAQMMEKRAFRADLFYRLSVVTLQIPPLRARREDILGLVESHLEHFRIALRRPVNSIHEDALARLIDHSWPGNVRELINVIERAVLLCEGPEVNVRDLPAGIRQGSAAGLRPLEEGVAPSAKPGEEQPDLLELPFFTARRLAIDTFERSYLESVLVRSHGRIRDSARLAGMHTRSLYEKMRRLGLQKEFFKLKDRS